MSLWIADIAAVYTAAHVAWASSQPPTEWWQSSIFMAQVVALCIYLGERGIEEDEG